jgi:hypothetical protein
LFCGEHELTAIHIPIEIQEQSCAAVQVAWRVFSEVVAKMWRRRAQKEAAARFMCEVSDIENQSHKSGGGFFLLGTERRQESRRKNQRTLTSPPSEKARGVGV